MSYSKQITRMVAVGACFASLASAKAANITVGDANTSTKIGATTYTEGGTGWYKGGTGPSSEYAEVEPGMSTGAQWDLVAFNYDNSDLSILSGFDLKDGQASGAKVFQLGHLFIDTDGVGTRHLDPNGDFDATEDNGTRYDYEIGITFDFSAGTYTAYRLGAGTLVYNNFYSPDTQDYNAASNPWRFAPGDDTTVITTKGMTFVDNTLSDAAASAVAGFSVSNRKYLLTLDDLSWLTGEFANANVYDTAFFHLTLECGNDNMEGVRDGGFDVPEGGLTLAMLGAAFAGLSLIRRRE